MAKIIKSMTIRYEDERKITEYCRVKGISFSQFVSQCAIERVNQNGLS